jgi:hypothetical protein
MTDFEYVLCCLLIPVVYVTTYIAGRYDILGQVCRALEEKVKELNKKDGEGE